MPISTARSPAMPVRIAAIASRIRCLSAMSPSPRSKSRSRQNTRCFTIASLFSPMPRLLGLPTQAGDEIGDHCFAEILRPADRKRVRVVSADIVTDADGKQLDRRALLDLADDGPQVALEVAGVVLGEGGLVARRAVRNDHQHLARLG